MERKTFLLLSGVATLLMATSAVWAEAAEESGLKQQLVQKSEGMPENSPLFSLEMLAKRPNGWGNLDDPMSQVTNVNQLRDVQPDDWAYEALRSLVERYGCIVGYPNKTFRGKRAITRYEFAAGLNACVNQIERLLANTEAILREDISKLQRLMREFEAELAFLGARVDNLEGRLAFLEDHQFSTTTKLSGEVIFSLAGAGGGDKDSSDGFKGNDAQIVFNNRVRLNLTTSFSGQDLLITGLQAHNFQGAVDGSGSIQNTLFPNESLLTSGSTKLSFEPQFPRFNPQDISQEIPSNDVQIYKLLYIFPSGLENLTLFAGPSAETTDAFPAIIPFSSEGQGAISRFATLNPVIRVSGGTSQDGLASAGGFIWNIADGVDWRALYASVSAPIPTAGPTNVLGAGLFNGSIVTATQVTLTPTENFDLGLNYAYSYHTLNILGTGLTRFSATPLNIPGRTVNPDGTLNVGGILDTPVQIHSVGTAFNWNFTPSVAFTGYFSYFFVNSAGGPSASSDFLSWMTGFSFKDLFKEGNTAGLIFGQPLNRVWAGGSARLREPNVDRAIPYHLEVFYNYKLTDNISITPGVFILFNPESNANNDTTTVGVLRTTFRF